MNVQRTFWTLPFAAVFLITTIASAADPVAPIQLRYTMPPGETNAYTFTVTQQGESGKETMRGTLIVRTRMEGNSLTVSFKGMLHQKMTPGSPMMMGYRLGGSLNLSAYLGYNFGPAPESREMVIDETGHILRLSGDSVLPAPLGSLLGSFLIRVPPTPTAGWEQEAPVFLLDEPLLAGPVIAFQPAYGPVPYYPGRGPQATLSAREKISVKVTEATAETVTLQRESVVESLLRTGNEPRLGGSSKTTVVLERAGGWPRLVEIESKIAALTDNVSRRSLLTLKWELLQGAEREAALKPPNSWQTWNPTTR